MTYKKIVAIIIAITLMVGVFASCKKSADTAAITGNITQKADADDSDTVVVSETEKNNIVILKDHDGNSLSLIPINDVSNKIMLSGYVKSAKDKNNKEIKDKNILGKVVAISADTSKGAAVYSIMLKENKTVFLDFFTNKKQQIVAVKSATDGKYYEVVTENGEKNVYMHLKGDAKGKPIEVLVKKANGKTQIVEKNTGKNVADDAEKDGSVNTSGNQTTSTTKKKTDNTEKKDNVVNITDYSDLADVNVVLEKNSKASVGLASGSPIKVDATKKAYISKDSSGTAVLNIVGNGDYYITQKDTGSQWYGKIVVTLGTKGVARVRVAGINVYSKEATGIEFLDKDTYINDTGEDGEVLVYKNQGTDKSSPAAILSFVDSTTNTINATGTSNKGTGTVYSECRLSIKGHGSASIVSKNKNGIQSERSLGIQNATLDVDATAGKGMRVKGLVDIEENANITINSMGDAVRCNDFLMDKVAIKDSSGKTTGYENGSTVNIYATSSDAASATTGDGIDADDSVIVRSGKLNINVQCAKAKYGIKVRRVDNEEFLNVIKSEKIGSIKDFINDSANESNPFYNDVKLNEKEYTALMTYKDKPNTSADYQGIRSGSDDTFRFTGGTTKVLVKQGRNTSVKDSANSQKSISASINVSSGTSRTISIASHFSSDSNVFALLYSGSDIKTSDKVNFGRASKRQPEHDVAVKFAGNIGTATPNN